MTVTMTKTLFDPETTAEIRERIARLTPQSARLWGKMDVAQMAAHLANAMEQATGDLKPPRMLLGRLFGSVALRQALKDKPMPRNAPTAPALKIVDQRELDRERQRLLSAVEKFAAGGPKACTTHPHTFFGPMSPEQWAQLMYKHCDHHLRQFSA